MAQRGISDFRSDTVTWPTEAMYRAMREAPLGNDGFHDDPTVIELEEVSAKLLGKESAVFCPSGTMANQIAGRVHASPGQEVVLEEGAHVLNFESGGLAYAGLQLRPVAGVRGVMAPEQVGERIRRVGSHNPGTGLVWLENTHNLAGGRVMPQENSMAIANIAHQVGLPVHLDGARIFNAQVASGISAKKLSQPADSVMFCLSKGLCCPVGSVLCGSSEFIERARDVRQRLGGTMRQAGILAACGLVALRENIDRLAEDHARARVLAEGLAQLRGIEIRIDEVETNMVYFHLKEQVSLSALELEEGAREQGVWIIGLGERVIRMVTHKDVDESDVARALEVIGGVLAGKK